MESLLRKALSERYEPMKHPKLIQGGAKKKKEMPKNVQDGLANYRKYYKKLRDEGYSPLEAKLI